MQLKNAYIKPNNIINEVLLGLARSVLLLKQRHLTNISGEIWVKRKFTGKLSKWWYIIRAEEGLLKELDGKWEIVKLQTPWKLEPCYKQSDVKLLNSRQDIPRSIPICFGP